MGRGIEGRAIEVRRWGEGKRESGEKGEGEIKTEKRNEVRVNAVSSLLLFPIITENTAKTKWLF